MRNLFYTRSLSEQGGLGGNCPPYMMWDVNHNLLQHQIYVKV
ncbi:hypothetical protein QUA44_04130 [Microcoleus sp. N9_A2]